MSQGKNDSKTTNLNILRSVLDSHEIVYRLYFRDDSILFHIHPDFGKHGDVIYLLSLHPASIEFTYSVYGMTYHYTVFPNSMPSFINPDTHTRKRAIITKFRPYLLYQSPELVLDVRCLIMRIWFQLYYESWDLRF